jgi:S-adenosylmethionine:tRNA ribosyltransferase-isomerase
MVAPRTTFALPAGLSATEPPEARGLQRDGVRLLVARPDGMWHGRFADIAHVLEPGDVVVVNTSKTVAAAVDGRRRDGGAVTVHFATALDDGSWVVEVRPGACAKGPVRDVVVGERVELPAGASLTVLRCYPTGCADDAPNRLWVARVAIECDVPCYLSREGRPIAYDYMTERWPLAAYQTVFAREPGSAEMPSAARPFTTELVTSLVSAGVVVAPITLHTGVSSLEEGEEPLPERFAVPAATARLVNLARAHGGRVVAVGTTVTRALESAADQHGAVVPSAGWTDLVLGPHRPARVVTGLVTGWHAPGASHLLLLEAVAGGALVEAAYREALRERYLWHEFGDSCLFLPDRDRAQDDCVRASSRMPSV